MSNMQRVRRGVFITLLFTAGMAPAHAAEPLTMFLLKMLRDQMASSALESAVNGMSTAAVQPPAASALAGVYGVSEEQLRALIDTGFVHLTSAQRAEVYASLTRMLADPKNALARPLIIEELAQQASAVRGAHERLAALTPAEKRAIATDARAEYERLPPGERDRLRQMLQAVGPPRPGCLNDLILGEFAAAPALAGTGVAARQ